MRSRLTGADNADLPLALLAAGFILWLAFQTVQLVRESEAIDAFNRNQDNPLQEASRLRQATDSLAAETADLASSGNAGAKLVLDEMARQNVTLKRSGTGGSSAASATGTAPTPEAAPAVSATPPAEQQK